MEFFATWPDALGSQDNSQVGHFGVAEETFGQVDFKLVLFEFGKNLVMVFVGGSMDDDVDYVDDDVSNAIKSLQ